MTYTIKQLAGLAGVTTRTIRYYDQVGLLDPAVRGANGYRYYDQLSLLTLQQIMFFRELDMPLKDIQLIMNQPGYNLLDALKKHRASLYSRLTRVQNLLNTLDKTMQAIKGERLMSKEEYFAGFDESKYKEEAHQRWGGTPQYEESRQKWASYSPDQKEAIKQEGDDFIRRLVGQDAALKPDDPVIQAAVSDYFVYLNCYFYTCDVTFLRNLAEMWVADPRFAVNYENIREGGAEFARQAVHYFCDQNS